MDHQTLVVLSSLLSCEHQLTDPKYRTSIYHESILDSHNKTQFKTLLPLPSFVIDVDKHTSCQQMRFGVSNRHSHHLPIDMNVFALA